MAEENIEVTCLAYKVLISHINAIMDFSLAIDLEQQNHELSKHHLRKYYKMEEKHALCWNMQKYYYRSLCTFS